jgi:hypothetical protein
MFHLLRPCIENHELQPIHASHGPAAEVGLKAKICPAVFIQACHEFVAALLFQPVVQFIFFISRQGTGGTGAKLCVIGMAAHKAET